MVGEQTMFRGINNATLDDKGRLALPARFRDILREGPGDSVVVTIDMTERCLLMYPLVDWEALQQRLEALGNVGSRNRNLQRLLIGHAADLELDGSGRLRIPTPLCDYADLSKKLVCVGQGRKIEIWDAQCWHARMETWLADDSLKNFEDSDGVNGLSL